MGSRIISRSPLCAAALLLCVIATGQWPAKWHPTSSQPDQGECVAVDRRGNVYVAGKSKSYSGGTDFDFAIVKYDGAGVFQWDRRYDGPQHADDIPMALAVDYDGNVYCAGTSWGTTTQRDIAVIKLNTNGFRVWPDSGGGAGGLGGDDPGWIFHEGAFRTTTPYDEGNTVSGVSMAVRQSINPDDRIIAVTFARTSNFSATRTLVIEPHSTSPGGVRMKDGWPISYPVVSPRAWPWGVAIHTDNSVYICGEEHDAILGHFFTTVRFKAAGKQADGGPVRWHHRYRPFIAKPNSARAIVLDRHGNAYVTGIISNGSDGAYRYATIRINEGWDGETLPGYEWDQILPSTSSLNVATAIDLVHEVENGVLVPYVYVTGHSNFQITTIRYRGDTGAQAWANPAQYSSASPWNEFARTPRLYAAGRGNAYVVGETRATGWPNYVILAYNKLGGERWPAVIYDGPCTRTLTRDAVAS